MTKPRLLFVAPWFLFPRASGGRIRTTDILGGMKGGAYDITLVSPAPTEGDWAADIERICDRFVPWLDDTKRSTARRVRALASSLPVSVALDRSAAARACIRAELAKQPDVLVADFVHTGILLDAPLPCPSVVFTHNVESEIYKRTAERAENFAQRAVWRSQHRKMERFEREQLARFDIAVAVSERDGDFFREQFGHRDVRVIPTSVDVDFFHYQAPGDSGDLTSATPTIVFTGSMDWHPNIDGVRWLMEEIWPRIAAAAPGAKVVIAGRRPDERLVAEAKARAVPFTFTGFVDDIRVHVHGADVCVIPLRVGGGTRLKAYEAMAMGCPVVSTTIGIEGLPLTAGDHCLVEDDPDRFADAVIMLLRDASQRRQLARAANGLVTENFSAQAVARVFEGICLDTPARFAAR